MKIRLLNLLLMGSIVALVMLSSCSKDDNQGPENPGNSQDKGVFKDARDSKEYKWVKIGEQIWMAENLAYTGIDIRYITDDDEWGNNPDDDGWCYYKSNENYASTYGVLYQWEAAKIACPSGWHLPTDNEWTQLENYLKENGFSYDGIVGNDGIAKSLATATGWSTSSNKGTIGNNDFPDSQNKTGFSALPGGYRSNTGSFFNLRINGNWWSANTSDFHKAYYRGLIYEYDIVHRDKLDKSIGISVRCVRD